MSDEKDSMYYDSNDDPINDDDDRCIISDFGGKAHPYSYCIKNTNDMTKNPPEATPNGLKKTGFYVRGILNYGEGLLCKPELSVKTSDGCKGVLGNRYVLRTGQDCKEVNADNGAVTDQIQELSKYINNESDGSSILTGGAEGSCKGIIPSTLGSVGKINAFGILGAFVGPTTPYCMKARVKCHLVDDKLGEARNFTGFSKHVYFNICDLYNHIKASDLYPGKPAGLDKVNIDGKGINELCGGALAELGITAFTNMNLNPKSSHELGGCQSTKWGCCPGQNQLFGKAKLDKKGSNCNNIEDNDKNIIDTIFNSYSNNKNQNDNMINLYIISISLLFMFIIFKLITKKK